MSDFVKAVLQNQATHLLVDMGLKGFAVVVVATAFYLTVQKRSAALRHLVLTVACIGLVSLPVLSAMLPSLQISLETLLAGAADPVASTADKMAVAKHIPTDRSGADHAGIAASDTVPQHDLFAPAWPAQPEPASNSIPPETVAPATETHLFPSASHESDSAPMEGVSYSWVRLLPHVWLTSAALSLLMPLVGLLAIARLSRASKPITDEAWLRLTHRLESELGIVGYISLLSSSEINTALTWGVFRPKLLLPKCAEEWSESQRHAVLLHELAHIRRLDWAIQMLTHLACAMHWFNPLVWWMSRRMQIDREQASDDVALSAGINPADYASQLVQVAADLRPLQTLAAIPMAQKSTLRQRVTAVLDAKRPRGSIGRVAVAIAIVVCCCAIVPVAMLKATEGSTQQEPEDSEEDADERIDEDAAKAVVLSPEKAAAYLRAKKGVLVGESVEADRITWKTLGKTYYPHVTLKREWVAEPEDWQYIANLARRLNGFRQPHNVMILIEGPVEPATLAECFKSFRSSKNNSFELVVDRASLNRASLQVLGSYPGLRLLHASTSTDDVTDKDWAAVIAGWPNAERLFLPPSAGPKAIVAASKLENLASLSLKNNKLIERELEPLRKHKRLKVLVAGEGTSRIEYLIPGGFGKWPDLKYNSGYAPVNPPEGRVGALPDALWGEPVNGLQAALSADDRLRVNETGSSRVVVRNVSQKTIRISLPTEADELQLLVGGKKPPQVVDPVGRTYKRWEIAPGQQIDISCSPLQCRAKGEIGLRRGFSRIPPGEHQLVGVHGNQTLVHDCPTGRQPVPWKFADGEWRGTLRTAPRKFELLAEKVPFEVRPPSVVKADHGLKPTFKSPERLAQLSNLFVIGREEARIYLDHQSDAHWIVQTEYYSNYVYWGPLNSQQLKELGLVDFMEQRIREAIANPVRNGHGRERIMQLVSRNEPLAARGLALVPLLDIPANPAVNNLTSANHRELVALIRKRQEAFAAMELAAETNRALKHLTANDPRLPPDEEFEVIAASDRTPAIPDSAWGPEVEGVRAAALIPGQLRRGEEKPVRLFLRNVGKDPVYLTVADRAGYDYATAKGTRGEALRVRADRIWPELHIIPGPMGPEEDPGRASWAGPLCQLVRLKLQPGATFELRSKTILAYPIPVAEEKAAVRVGSHGTAKEGKPALSRIMEKAAKATVTWHLHTANGVEHKTVGQDRHRTWPTVGGWSGVLQTAPTVLNLME